MRQVRAVSQVSVHELGRQYYPMGGAYIADFAMYATADNRTPGEKRPGVRHPGEGRHNAFSATSEAMP